MYSLPQRSYGAERVLRLRIFLVGFMCSGKTTVGSLLAEKLHWKFIDIDSEIEKSEGMSIPDIFKVKGEEHFRGRELEYLRRVSREEKVVVSTGGGLGANPEAMKLMKEAGLVVWLKLPFEEFLRRCARDENRPLLRKSVEELKRLMSEREKTYSLAHLWLKPDTPERMVEKIMEARDRSPGINPP